MGKTFEELKQELAEEVAELQLAEKDARKAENDAAAAAAVKWLELGADYREADGAFRANIETLQLTGSAACVGNIVAAHRQYFGALDATMYPLQEAHRVALRKQQDIQGRLQRAQDRLQKVNAMQSAGYVPMPEGTAFTAITAKKAQDQLDMGEPVGDAESAKVMRTIARQRDEELQEILKGAMDAAKDANRPGCSDADAEKLAQELDKLRVALIAQPTKVADPILTPRAGFWPIFYRGGARVCRKLISFLTGK